MKLFETALYISIFIFLTSCQNIDGIQEATNSNVTPEPGTTKNRKLPALPPDAFTQEGSRSNTEWRDFLVQLGDLPTHHKGGENIIIASPHPITNNFPGLQLIATQWLDLIERDGEIGGEVTVYIYDSLESAQQGYIKSSSTMYQSESIDTFGEQAQVWQHQNMTLVIFQRCRMVLKVKGMWQINPAEPRGFFRKEDVIAYAERLDQRITSSACQ